MVSVLNTPILILFKKKYIYAALLLQHFLRVGCGFKMMMSSICDDISEFLDTLKRMRVVDDKIVYALNKTVPTESFSLKVDPNATCKDLFGQIVHTHVEREKSLQQCLSTTTRNLENLREQKNSNPNNLQLQKNLKREQIKLREIQTQINVEEVIREQTMKVFHSKCRAFYKPSQEEKEAINFRTAQ